MKNFTLLLSAVIICYYSIAQTQRADEKVFKLIKE